MAKCFYSGMRGQPVCGVLPSDHIVMQTSRQCCLREAMQRCMRLISDVLSYVALACRAQLLSLRARMAADAEVVQRLQGAAAALMSERAAAVRRCAAACAAADELKRENDGLRRRAAAAEGFAAAVRRSAAFDTAEAGLAACGDDAPLQVRPVWWQSVLSHHIATPRGFNTALVGDVHPASHAHASHLVKTYPYYERTYACWLAACRRTLGCWSRR